MSMYRNFEKYDAREIAFYEIFRRHTSTDPRDGGCWWDYLIGTASTESHAKDIVHSYQKQSDIILKTLNGYRAIFEKTVMPDRVTGVNRTHQRLTGEYTDKYGYEKALAEFRKTDPSYYAGEKPTYGYRAIRRAPEIFVCP